MKRVTVDKSEVQSGVLSGRTAERKTAQRELSNAEIAERDRVRSSADEIPASTSMTACDDDDPGQLAIGAGKTEDHGTQDVRVIARKSTRCTNA